MIWLFIFLNAIPHAVESFLDRKGEDKTGKKKDSIWMLLVAACFCVAERYVLHKDSIQTLGLFIAWRVLFFDYLTNWFLKQRENHRHINIWKYSGGSTYFWDQFIKYIDWRVRIVIRVLLFSAALFWFLHE